jgi:hypothetical protein
MGSSSLTLQQLSLQEQVIAELRSSTAALETVIASKEAVIESKDAVILSKGAVIQVQDKLLAKVLETSAQQPDSSARSNVETAALVVQRMAVAEASLNQLEAAGGSKVDSSAAVSDREQKRPRHGLNYTQALEKDEILDEIFGFVGMKEWLYAGGVRRRWRGRYLSMCCKACSSKAEHARQTSHKSSFVTAARFSLALESGLEMPDEDETGEFFDDLPLLSQQPIEVLTLARVHGVPGTIICA